MKQETRKRLLRGIANYFEGPNEGMLPNELPNEKGVIHLNVVTSGKLMAEDILDLIEGFGFKIVDLKDRS